MKGTTGIVCVLVVVALTTAVDAGKAKGGRKLLDLNDRTAPQNTTGQNPEQNPGANSTPHNPPANETAPNPPANLTPQNPPANETAPNPPVNGTVPNPPSDLTPQNPGTGPKPCEGKRRYELKIRFNWSKETHPDSYPYNGGMFSPVIVATHSRFYSMWAEGQYVSPGVQKMVRFGDPNWLQTELNRLQGRKVVSIASYLWPENDNSETLIPRLWVHEGLTKISAISTLHPSPDWFVGLSNVDVCDDGQWLYKVEGVLSVFDGGSNAGKYFNVRNRPNVNVQQIRSIDEEFSGVPVGTWELKRIPLPE